MAGLLVQQREASMSVLAFFLKLLDPGAIQRAEGRGCQQAAANLQARNALHPCLRISTCRCQPPRVPYSGCG